MQRDKVDRQNIAEGTNAFLVSVQMHTALTPASRVTGRTIGRQPACALSRLTINNTLKVNAELIFARTLHANLYLVKVVRKAQLLCRCEMLKNPYS